MNINNNDIKNKMSSSSILSFVMSPFKSNKNLSNVSTHCKICNEEFSNEDKICDCLKSRSHPNNKETDKIIKEHYIQKKELFQQVLHIDKNPEKLTHLVNDIYEIVERSSLHEDLTPKTLAKVKENLVNEICVHLEDYMKESDE